MYFTICSADYVAYHADAHTRAIFSHSNTRDAINLSIEGLVTAGATECEFTRSIALVARKIADDLESGQVRVGHQFAACLAGAAVSVFLSYWTVRPHPIPPISHIHLTLIKIPPGPTTPPCTRIPPQPHRRRRRPSLPLRIYRGPLLLAHPDLPRIRRLCQHAPIHHLLRISLEMPPRVDRTRERAYPPEDDVGIPLPMDSVDQEHVRCS